MKRFFKWFSGLFNKETEAQKLMKETAWMDDLKTSGKDEAVQEWLRNRSK